MGLLKDPCHVGRVAVFGAERRYHRADCDFLNSPAVPHYPKIVAKAVRHAKYVTFQMAEWRFRVNCLQRSWIACRDSVCRRRWCSVADRANERGPAIRGVWVDAARKRAGVVVAESGLAPWSGRQCAIHGGTGRSRLNRVDRWCTSTPLRNARRAIGVVMKQPIATGQPGTSASNASELLRPVGRLDRNEPRTPSGTPRPLGSSSERSGAIANRQQDGMVSNPEWPSVVGRFREPMKGVRHETS